MLSALTISCTYASGKLYLIEKSVLFKLPLDVSVEDEFECTKGSLTIQIKSTFEK